VIFTVATHRQEFRPLLFEGDDIAVAGDRYFRFSDQMVATVSHRSGLSFLTTKWLWKISPSNIEMTISEIVISRMGMVTAGLCRSHTPEGWAFANIVSLESQ
jgi:hypothetical protein